MALEMLHDVIRAAAPTFCNWTSWMSFAKLRHETLCDAKHSIHCPMRTPARFNVFLLTYSHLV